MDEDADAGRGPGEHWTEKYQSDDSCADYRTVHGVFPYQDTYGSKRKNGYDGYVYRSIAIRRTIDGVERLHCVKVYHPPGAKTAAGKTVRIAQYIDAAWYRMIENTLLRLPWLHLQQVRAMVIDDRPILHGVASFDRKDPAHDARDGHTIWLNERLFTRPNHQGPGNYGKTWSYHLQRDGERVFGQPAEHDLFSPVLIHEIGHLVNYGLVNGSSSDPTCPPCARMCGDFDTCAKETPAQKEATCATAYCTGFGYASGTENWAEMYRWFYQSSETRELLRVHFPSCFALLDDAEDGDGINSGMAPPWELGWGEVIGYHKTLWDSCEQRACKAY